jgi:hypothetical protein
MLLASPAAWAALNADWRMNERSGPMIDSSPHNNHGHPRQVARTGSTYLFNGSSSRVSVPDHKSLDPAKRHIKLSAFVRVNGAWMDDDSYDIVRKGFSKTPGGDYKMEIKRMSNPTVGKLHCLFKGSGGTVDEEAPPDIVDGRWHTLECIKRSNFVVARVDGQSYRETGSAGSIANSNGVRIGARTTNPLDDMFDGSMNFVRINISRAQR